MSEPICPDCNLPVSSHDELYKDGRCPVVRFAPVTSVEVLAVIETLPEPCPVCKHSDSHHDENGCDVDGCTCEGP